nr:ATP-binding protein [Cellulosimicrobium arenosum]
MRRSALEAWSSSPTRLREDSNTEEDHAHGSYRDRVVVEIAQNAADAALRAGGPGRLRLSLDAPSAPDRPWVLRAANTGAPLDAAGVASLAAMRASASSRPLDGARPGGDDEPGGAVGDGAVGRFGTGFAALRSVADVIRIGARERAVEMSLERTRAELATITADRPGLARTVASRGDRLPVLRLPFPASVRVPVPEAPAGGGAGWATVVELELRDDVALAAVRAQLAGVDDVLLLALPGLQEITVVDGDERRLADVEERWVVVRAAGEVPAGTRASLPVEDRRRDRWSVAWATPRDGSRPPAAGVLHAPTPTDEPLTFPALLLASFPLDPSRRHVPPGPTTDLVAREAGRAYARLVAARAPALGPRTLGLVPTGLPAGVVDAAVRDAALSALSRTAIVPLVDGPGALVPPPESDGGLHDTDEALGPGSPGRGTTGLVTPQQACVVPGPVGADPAVRRTLGVADLVDVPADLLSVARSLGVEVLDLADVVEQLPGAGTDTGVARLLELYGALAPHVHDADVRDALGALPVLLVDGRTVRGPRGLVVLADPGDDDRAVAAARRLADLGLRVVDPRAAHPVLERLGARPVALRGLVGEPALRERALAAARAADDGEQPDTDALVGFVSDVVAGEDAQGDLRLPFWWGEIPLRTTGGDLVAARGCVLAGTWADEVLDGLDVVAPEVVDRWGVATLRALGVVTEPVVHVVRDVVTPLTGVDEDLDPHAAEGWLSDWAGYLEHLADVLGPGVHVGDVPAVADLDAVHDDAWPAALERIAGRPDLRSALLDPVRAEGRGIVATSYTSWWLRTELGAPFALGQVPWLPAAPRAVADARGVDDRVLAAVGGVASLGGVAPGAWPGVLDAVADVGAPVGAEDALELWHALVTLAAAGEVLDPPPDRLPALTENGVRVVAAQDAVVAPDPMWTPLRPVVPAPAALLDDVADLLDLDVVPADAPAPESVGEAIPVPDAAGRVVGPVAAVWFRHEALRVDGVRVPWWVERSGADARVHATDQDGLAEALAAAAGRYGRRHLVAAVLRSPDDAETLLAATAWEVQPRPVSEGSPGSPGTGAR